jgi:hypothetical protein
MVKRMMAKIFIVLPIAVLWANQSARPQAKPESHCDKHENCEEAAGPPPTLRSPASAVFRVFPHE